MSHVYKKSLLVAAMLSASLTAWAVPPIPMDEDPFGGFSSAPVNAKPVAPAPPSDKAAVIKPDQGLNPPVITQVNPVVQTTSGATIAPESNEFKAAQQAILEQQMRVQNAQKQPPIPASMSSVPRYNPASSTQNKEFERIIENQGRMLITLENELQIQTLNSKIDEIRRKPGGLTAVPTVIAKESAPSTPVAEEPTPFAFLGVFNSGGEGLRAMLRTSGGADIIVQKNQVVSGWKITSIDASSISIVKGKQKRKLY